MKHAIRLTKNVLAAAGLLLGGLSALPARGESNLFPTFNVTDLSGTPWGSMTLTGTTASTRYGYQPLTVQFSNRVVLYTGQGIYHDFQDDDSPKPECIFSATVRNAFGDVLVLNGYVHSFRDMAPAGISANGGMSFYPIGTPGNVTETRLVPALPPPAGPIVNSSPTLSSWWAPVTNSQAVGGSYEWTGNNQTAQDSMAAWTGSIPGAGTYQVSVWVPPYTTGLPRTSHAVYWIGGSDAAGHPSPVRMMPPVSQNIAGGGWVEVATFHFNANYTIILYDTTGEPTNSRSVVANAIQLVRVGD